MIKKAHSLNKRMGFNLIKIKALFFNRGCFSNWLFCSRSCRNISVSLLMPRPAKASNPAYWCFFLSDMREFVGYQVGCNNMSWTHRQVTK
jgi:hypothetical protein